MARSSCRYWSIWAENGSAVHQMDVLNTGMAIYKTHCLTITLHYSFKCKQMLSWKNQIEVLKCLFFRCIRNHFRFKIIFVSITITITVRSHQLANTGHYCDRNGTSITRRRAASVDLRTVATEFCSDGLYAITQNSPVREFFFPGNGIFFPDPKKSSPVNIPSCNTLTWKTCKSSPLRS